MEQLDDESGLDIVPPSRPALWPLLVLIPTFAGIGFLTWTLVIAHRGTRGFGDGLAIVLGLLACGVGGLLSCVALFFAAPLRRDRWTRWWMMAVLIAGGAVLGALTFFVVAINQPSRGHPDP